MFLKKIFSKNNNHDIPHEVLRVRDGDDQHFN